MSSLYAKTLNTLKDNIEDMRDTLNTSGLNGNTPLTLWNSQIQGKVEEVEQLNTEIDSLNKDNEQLQNDKQQLEDKNNQLESDKEELNTEIIQLNKDKDSLNTEIDQLNSDKETLNATIDDDNTNFDDIFVAIVSKGQTPTRSDRTTYAPAIRNIVTDSDGSDTTGSTFPDDYEINYWYHLFGTATDSSGRPDLIKYLLPYMKNPTNANDVFYGCLIPDGSNIVLDITPLKNVSNAALFEEASPADANSEITLHLKTSYGYIRKAFQNLNKTRQLGLINCVIELTGTTDLSTYLAYCFYYATNVKSIEFKNFLDSSYITTTDISYMFNYFNIINKTGMLTDINFEDMGLPIDWSTITNISYLCDNAKYINSVKFVNDEIPTLTSVFCRGAFGTCTSLKEVSFNLVEPNNSNAAHRHRDMFYNDTSLTTINSDKLWVLAGSAYNMFYNCKNLVTIPAIKFYNYNITNADTTEYMFYNCSSLEEITLYIIYYTKHNLYSQYMFYGCSKLKKIKGNLDLSYLYTTNYMFTNCSSLESIETTGSFCGNNTKAMTLDLSASAVFDIEGYLDQLATNSSGYTQTIKLNSTVYNSLTDNAKSLASTKKYTLASA